MTRRQIAHSSIKKIRTTQATVYRNLSGKSHVHPCYACRVVYMCNCTNPAVNERCQYCRTEGRLDHPVWEVGRFPKPCCTDNCRQVTDNDELIRYGLAGPGPWFQCKTCARSHPKPITTERNA